MQIVTVDLQLGNVWICKYGVSIIESRPSKLTLINMCARIKLTNNSKRDKEPHPTPPQSTPFFIIIIFIIIIILLIFHV